MSNKIKTLIDKSSYHCGSTFSSPEIDYDMLTNLIIAELESVMINNFYSDPNEFPDFIADVKSHFGALND